MTGDTKGLAMKVEQPAAEDSSPKSALSRIPFQLSSSSSEDEKCASERSSEPSSDSEDSDLSSDHSASISSDVDSELESDDDCTSPRRKKKRKTAPNADEETRYSDDHAIKQRDNNPPRRKVGRRIYDSVLGRTCHWCRQKTVEDHAECSLCPIRFCGACLSNRNGENISEETGKGVKWICPKCRGGCGPGCKNCCNCGPCRKTQNLAPTGQFIQVARRFGFDNVHDYLVHLKTKESPAVIAARKEGRGWTKSTGAARKEGRRWTKSTGARLNISVSSDEEEDHASDGYNVVKREFDGHTKISTKDTDKHEPTADTRKIEESSVTEGVDDASQVLGGLADSKSDDKLGEKVEQSCSIANGKNSALRSSDAKRSPPVLPGAKAKKVKWAPDRKVPEEDLISTIASEVSENCRGSFGCIGGAEFARKLECTLQRPFSTLQLKQMQEHVNFRKPIMRTRHIRNRAIEVPCSEDGLSYLEHYQDFAEELATAGLPEEKLKLLRGFFFWLQHSSMEGSFRPWAKRESANDTKGGDCVEVRPDCEVIRVLLAIDEDEVNHLTECEDVKPQIKMSRSAVHPISQQSFSQPTVKVKIEKE